MGYVVHTYPSVSHTFVLREVLGLRRHGGRVATFAIHQATEADLLAGIDREEANSTKAVLPIKPWRLARSHLRALRAGRSSYVRALRFALGRAPGGPRSVLWQAFYFAEAIVVWDLARSAGVRHLHAHLTNVAADAAWLASAFGGTVEPGAGWRWSMTVHGPTEFFAVRQFNLAAKVAAADLVVCISNFCRSQLMAFVEPEHWAKLQIVHCGVDLERYAFRRRERSSGEPLRVLSVGRLVPEKGQALLIDATERLMRTGRSVTLTLVGDGPDRARLEAAAEAAGVTGIVRFTGPLGQDELPAVFADHDVFCLPSFAEGVPVVFMEAMATGLPVIATRIAGIPELIDDGVTGRLVAPGSSGEVFHALEALIADGSMGLAWGEAARLKVEAEFDADQCAERLLGIFIDLERAQSVD